jgi:hypothetical protein
MKCIVFDKYKDLRMLIIPGTRGMLELLPKLTRWDKITVHIPPKYSSFDIYVIHKLKSRSLICCIKCFQNLIVLLSRKNSHAHNWKQREFKNCFSRAFLKWKYLRVVSISTKSVLIFEITTWTFWHWWMIKQTKQNMPHEVNYSCDDVHTADIFL